VKEKKMDTKVSNADDILGMLAHGLSQLNSHMFN
jgi:hypothetical protein